MPRKAAKKKRKKPVEYETHYLTVDGWDAYYSFGVNDVVNIIPGPYLEHEDLKITGRITTEGYKYVPEYELRNTGDCSLDSHKESQADSEWKPLAVGFIQALKEHPTQIFIDMPWRALLLLFPIVGSGKLKEVYLYAEKIKWRKARVHNYHFSTELTDEEDR